MRDAARLDRRPSCNHSAPDRVPVHTRRDRTPAPKEADGVHDDELTTLTAALASDLDGAFEEVVRGFGDRLYAVALRLTGSPADAEEIAQDAFVRAFRALQGYEPTRIQSLALRPWLYQITINVARNRLRGKRPTLIALNGTVHDEDEAAPALEPVDGGEAPEAAAERREQGAELAALVVGLSPRYRAAVVLRHVEGLAYAEIAEVLEQPVGTVKANVHRGLRQLRQALERDEGLRTTAVGEAR
jgi:RNA polymerase sigma-70 factor (ECF subfamily)